MVPAGGVMAFLLLKFLSDIAARQYHCLNDCDCAFSRSNSAILFFDGCNSLETGSNKGF